MFLLTGFAIDWSWEIVRAENRTWPDSKHYINGIAAAINTLREP